MNHKALSLVCAIGLSSLLLSGCGTYDHRYNAPTHGVRGTAVNHPTNVTGFKPRGGLNYDGSSRSYDMYGTPMNGTGTYGIGGTAVSRAGTYTHGNAGPAATGTGMAAGVNRTGTYTDGITARTSGTGLGTGLNRSGIAGYGVYATDGIHRIPFGPAAGARGTAGYGMGMNRAFMAGAADTLVLGDTTIVYMKKGTKSLNGTAAGLTTRGAAAGQNRATTKMLVVTDPHTVKAMKRVKSALGSGNTSAKANLIGADIRYILKHASPMKGR